VTVVSDTTTLSELAKVGRLTLLRDLCGRIIVPREVHDELAASKRPAVQAVLAADWIDVVDVAEPGGMLAIRAETRLGLGECAAILLAEALQPQWVILDDRAARREAHRRGLPCIGTIGLLLLAKQHGLIPSVREVLDALVSHGTRIGQSLYQNALDLAGE
jgi:uncharacterized protein